MATPRQTTVLKLDAECPDPDAIRQAASVIKAGGLVAFPTETVYGLGADALDHKAVERVFEAKGRPPGTPLIVLVADREGLQALAAGIPPVAEALMERFWPGPLTLTFPASERVPQAVTGSGNTVAVRMPGSKVALELVRASGTPVVAPSANLFGHASPTSGDHVLKDLEGRIDLLLDAGNVGTGIESTILDICQSPPVLVRQGAVPLKDIEELIGKVNTPEGSATHYVPRGRLVIVKRGDREAVARLLTECSAQDKRAAMVTRYPETYRGKSSLEVRTMPLDLSAYARQLFGVLSELDETGIGCIAVEEVEEEGIGAAVMDRLRRAAKKSGEAGH